MKRLLILILLPLCVVACGGDNDNNASASVTANTSAGNTEATPKHNVKEAAALLKQASLKYLAGDKSGAVELLEKAAPLDPDNPELLAMLARALEKLQRYDDARAVYLRAAEHTEGKSLYNMQTGAAHCSELIAHQQYEAGEYDKAWVNIQLALDSPAISRETQMLHGYIQMQRKDYTDAAGAFEAAFGLSLGAQRDEALSWVGQAQYAGRDYQAGKTTFTKLIDQGIEGYEAYGWRAYCDLALQDKTGAEADFRQALQRTTNHAKAQEYRDAIKALEEAK